MSNSILRDVSDTALWVATFRAKETKRSDALFHDPLAEKLIGERGPKIARQMARSRYTSWSVVIRTYVIDQMLKKAIAGGVETILNLGAGLDTRPYRLDLPSNLKWIEVDYPQIIELKNDRLTSETPKCDLQRIQLDLADRDARVKFFSDLAERSQKVLVITEGVIPYLTNEQVATLADDLMAQPKFIYWIVEYFAPEVMKYLLSAKRRKMMTNAPFQFNPDDWFPFFASHGWVPKEEHYLGEESVRLGRPIPVPWWLTVLRFLMKPKDGSKYHRFTAYVLMGRKS